MKTFIVLSVVGSYAAAQTHTHSQQFQHADSWAVNRSELSAKSGVVEALELKCDTQEAEIQTLSQQVMTLQMFLDPLTTANTATTDAIVDLETAQTRQESELATLVEDIDDIYKNDYVTGSGPSSVTYLSVVKRTSELAAFQEQMKRLPDITELQTRITTVGAQVDYQKTVQMPALSTTTTDLFNIVGSLSSTLTSIGQGSGSPLVDSDLVNAELALIALSGDSGAISMAATSITGIETELATLTQTFEAQEIISDYFRVEAQETVYDGPEHIFTEDTFCLPAGLTLEFHLNLSTNVADSADWNDMYKLELQKGEDGDAVTVAASIYDEPTARFDSTDSGVIKSRPKNHSIFYKEKNTGATDLTFTIKATISQFNLGNVGIATKNYMIGVKILSETYPLVNTPTTDCS